MTAIEDNQSTVTGDDPAATDDALRLIGLFFVNFSRVVDHLEVSLTELLHPDSARGNRIMWGITGQLSANQLWTAWLAATAEWSEPNDAEKRIRTALGNRFNSLVTARNDLAHGVWFMSSITGVDVLGETVQAHSFEPSLMRSKPSKTGSELRRVLASRDRLAELSEEAMEVGSLVWEYWSGMMQILHGDRLDLPGITDRLGFDSAGKLVRIDLADFIASRTPHSE